MFTLQALDKPIRQIFQQYWYWALFFFWFLFFFPRWYVLSYTKLWELKQLIGQPWSKQVQIMHPPEMDRLVELRAFIQQQPNSTRIAVVLSDSPELVQAKSAPLIHGLLGSTAGIYSFQVLPPEDTTMIILVDSPGTASGQTYWQSRYPQATIISWEVQR